MDDRPSWGGERGTAAERGYGHSWTRLRGHILQRDMYLCQQCLRDDRVTPLGIKPRDHAVDHIKPKTQGGTDDPSNLQSLCSECHEAKSLSEAAHGRGAQFKAKTQYDAKGWPIWDTPAPKRWGYSIPGGVRPSGIPVVLVSGPPAAGKSTYIKANAQPGDTVIDFDIYRKQLGGAKWDTRPDIIRGAFKLRNAAIDSLHSKTSGTCYLIVTAPTKAERDEWTKALGDVTIHLIRTPQVVCIERIRANPERQDAATRQIQAVIDWWAAN
jgi:hypothetical protein